MTDTPGKEWPFLEMAKRIQRNLPEEFGGAFLIVPPKGDPISYSAFDPKPDDAVFWAMVDSAVQTAIAEFKQREQVTGMVRGQRR